MSGLPPQGSKSCPGPKGGRECVPEPAPGSYKPPPQDARRVNLAEVQSLLLRPARAASVAQLLLQVAPGGGGEALRLLARLLEHERGPQFPSHAGDERWPRCPPSFGPDAPAADRLQCSVGFSWRGLQALGMPTPYLRVFSRLAPAFAQGAPMRGARLGDSGASAPALWHPGFQLHAAHVLLTLHGPEQAVQEAADSVEALGLGARPLPRECTPAALQCVGRWQGARLGAPPSQQGEWVHFGYRDGLTDHAIEQLPASPQPLPLPLRTTHRAGEFLLGHANDSGFNHFGLPKAPEGVREFFVDSSFGVLRPLRQDVAAFEQAVARWRDQAHAETGIDVGSDWVKAKLCGRWPGGQALRPGQMAPAHDDFELHFDCDPAGRVCPWSAHVRRMRSGGHTGDAHQRDRPLLRRGMPYGPAGWSLPATEGERGLLGLFFCASLEEQFEHLLGQWANRRPLGAPDTSTAKDPLVGQHEDEQAAMLLPRDEGAAPLALRGFAPWTQALGTLYAWHPRRTALQRLLAQDYIEPDTEGPWL